jgi:hypothetical protein
MCFRMRRTFVLSVVKAMIPMSAERIGQVRGIGRARGIAQSYRPGERQVPASTAGRCSGFGPGAYVMSWIG